MPNLSDLPNELILALAEAFTDLESFLLFSRSHPHIWWILTNKPLRFIRCTEACSGSQIAMIYAIINADSILLSFLLEHASGVDVIAADGTTLHVAGSRAADDVVTAVMDEGVNIRFTARYRHSGRETPACTWAVLTREYGLALRLIDEGANVYATSNYGDTMLSQALNRRRHDIVNAILTSTSLKLQYVPWHLQ